MVSRIQYLEIPTGEAADFVVVAYHSRRRSQSQGAYAQSSDSRGVHCPRFYVRRYDWSETKGYCVVYFFLCWMNGFIICLF